jgi:hypothetical protein
MTENPIRRYVQDNVLIAEALPRLRLRVDPSLAYLGTSDFIIKGIARAQRYHFVEAEAGRVRRMLVAQFERFLPDNTRTYNYALRSPRRLGPLTFGHMVVGFSVAAELAEVPEVQQTARLLAEHGLVFEDEQIMSRFDAIIGEDRRHELLLFYHENLRDLGHTLAEAFDEHGLRPEFAELGEAVTARSLEAFVLEGGEQP